MPVVKQSQYTGDATRSLINENYDLTRSRMVLNSIDFNFYH